MLVTVSIRSITAHDCMTGMSSLLALVAECFICGKLSLVYKHGKCSPELGKQGSGMRFGFFKL